VESGELERVFLQSGALELAFDPAVEELAGRLSLLQGVIDVVTAVGIGIDHAGVRMNSVLSLNPISSMFDETMLARSIFASP
jgi:hypothetical protein